MPRKDPITGCMVMTQAEFWNAEAEHEGKGRCGADLMADMYEEMAQEDADMAERMKADLPTALEVLNGVLKDYEDHDNDHPVFRPGAFIEVVEVETAEVNGGFSKSSKGFVAKVRCADGNLHRVRYESWSTPGSFYEPPDGETTIEMLNDPPTHCCDCGAETSWEQTTEKHGPRCPSCYSKWYFETLRKKRMGKHPKSTSRM